MSTWAEFVINVKKLLPADADRQGLEDYVTSVIRQGAINLQSDIDIYRRGHETIYGVEDLSVEGEASVGTLPEQAEPRDAFYSKTGEPCDRQPAWKYDWGNRFDLICGKACLNGCQFAIAIDPQAKNFYVYPKVVDGRQFSIFWDGRKLDFADAEIVPFDEGAELAVSLFASAHIARKTNHELSEYNSYMADYVAEKRRLYLDAKERTRLKEQGQSSAPTESCPAPCAPCVTCATTEEAVAAADTQDDTAIEFCLIGDSGDAATIANTVAVADLIKRLDPDFVIHLGDCNYPSGEPVTLLDNFLKHYDTFISAQKLYFVYGEHDVQLDGGVAIAEALAYLKDLNSSKKYYEFARGPCRFFVLNGNASEPDGNTVGSIQEQWFQTQAAQSTEDWNIALNHFAPYTSDSLHTPGILNQRWSYAAANLVISGHGHNYERIQVSGFPYLVAGLGGAPKRGFGALTNSSQFRYNTAYGAIKATATKDQLQLIFYNVSGEHVDSLTLRKA